MWAVIAGGGTAGHVRPGLAIADELVAQGLDEQEIHFVGSSRGLETKLVPEAGFTLTALPGRGIVRRLTISNIPSVLGLCWAVIRATFMMLLDRPAVVVSVGGYAAVPAIVASWLLRIPLVIAEANAFPGAANRLAGRFAKASAVSFENTKLPNATLTGNPLRNEFQKLKRDESSRLSAREHFGIDKDKVVVGVLGGSLGAQLLNGVTLEWVKTWSDRSDLVVRHAVGSRDWMNFHRNLPKFEGGITYMPVEFETEIEQLYLAADLIVARSGATTVAELTGLGVPSILVPLPNAPGDHQTLNAKHLVDANAAVLIPNSELTAERLSKEVTALAFEPTKLEQMSKAAKNLGRPNAAKEVAGLVKANASHPWSK